VKKRRLILLAIVVGSSAVILVVPWRSRREPVYQGKTVTAWASDLNGPDPQARSNAGVALHAMGTAAVPFLVQSLNRRDPIFKQPFLSLAPKLPLWFRRLVVQTLKPFAAINDRLDKEPALVNSDPYGAGWMIKVKPTNPSEMDALMKSDAYTKHIGQ